MPTDTTVNNLVINKLTKAQYDAILSPSETELYLVPDVIDTAPTSGSDNMVTSGGVYTALSNKADASDIPTESTVSGWGFTKNAGTITGINMNGDSKGTSGVVDLGTVITAHQDISGKQDTLVSGTNIKTVNGESILGSGNLDVVPSFSIDSRGHLIVTYNN